MPALGRLGRGSGTIALVDQLMISGSNFAANIVLVRGLGLAEFGKYFLAYVLILYANAVQMSFVTTPMLVVAPMLDGKKKHDFLRGMLAMQMLASLLLLAIGLIAGLVMHFFTAYYSLQAVIAIACAIGAFQLQDWVRRYFFIIRQKRLAVASDSISYFLQLIVLAILWRTGRLTLVTTFWTMSSTSLAAFLLGPIAGRLSPSFSQLKESWEQCKGLSRDLLVSNQIRWFGSQGILLIATGIVGPTGIGGLRATQSLAGPVNLVLTSLDNVLPVRIADILKTKGTDGAFKFIRNSILLATLGLGMVVLPIALVGRPLLRIVYGPALVAYYYPMLLQLTNMIIEISGRLWVYLYRGVRDTRAILRANLLYTVVAVGNVYWLGHLFGVTGIVAASTLGQISIVSYCMFHWKRYRVELLERHPAPLVDRREAVALVNEAAAEEEDALRR